MELREGWIDHGGDDGLGGRGGNGLEGLAGPGPHVAGGVDAVPVGVALHGLADD
jgi:hypothetical protein